MTLITKTGVSADPADPRRKSPRYPSIRNFGGFHSQSGNFGEKRGSCSFQESNDDSQAIQSVA
jgi:hypothetical protein